MEQFLDRHFAKELSVKSYDEIRNDNYEKHAPFDFLFWRNGSADIEPIVNPIRNDITGTQDSFVKLSEHTRKLCRASNVKIAEVKSTQIRDSLKTQSGFNGNYDDQREVLKLINKIKASDDVFCYPYFKRSEASSNYTITDYCQLAKSKDAFLSSFEGEELLRRVIDLEAEHQCCDIFIRVYIDPAAKRGFVIGWMEKERLLDYNVRLKRMRQSNKSERALYFAKNLSEVKGIDLIMQVFENKSRVYASPYTRTNFYHKSLDCQFIKNVNPKDLIVFEGEDKAIEGGRYIRRCKNCF